MAAYIEDKLENQFFETTNDTQAITASQPDDKLQTSEHQPLRGVDIPLKTLYENHTTPFPEPDAPSPEPPCDVAESGTRKRKRITKLDCATTQDFDPPYKAATTEEKNEWKGFCEIESDPVCDVNLQITLGNSSQSIGHFQSYAKRIWCTWR